MPHSLFFTDHFSGTAEEESDVVNENGSKADVDSSTQTTDTSTYAPTTSTGKSSQQPTALFEREENKRSSFALQHPYALFSTSHNNTQNGTKVHVPESTAPAPTDDGQEEVSEICNNIDPILSAGATACAGEKETLTATASITSYVSKDCSSKSPQLATRTRETFLFGGFELITNVKTVEVYVIRSNDVSKASNSEEKESYLTTSKGIPLRDLPPLVTTPLHMDGTRPEEANASIENHGKVCDTLDLGTMKTEERDTFYKFVLVSPGGPKPLERVRLKFVKNKDECASGSIIVRTLKVKGRLSDSIPVPKASQQQSPGMLGGQRNDNMNSIASMMAMMGGGGAMGLPMAMQMSSQQQQLGQMQPFNQQQQQQDSHQQEKNQAEIISSVAGLGMFLKSSEERTMKTFESMLSDMEERIMKRLDGLAERLDVIESGIKEPTDNKN